MPGSVWPTLHEREAPPGKGDCCRYHYSDWYQGRDAERSWRSLYDFFSCKTHLGYWQLDRRVYDAE